MNYHVVSWSKLHSELFTLSQIISKDKAEFDLIIVIARGGLTVGHLLSDFLHLPVASLTISSYQSINKRHKPIVLCDVGANMTGKKILLVDDVSDTGKTFIHALAHIKKLGAKHVKTASIHIKPNTSLIPDYYVKKIDAWAIYPFETRETIEGLAKHWKKESTPSTILKRLEKLHFSKKYIRAFAHI